MSARDDVRLSSRVFDFDCPSCSSTDKKLTYPNNNNNNNNKNGAGALPHRRRLRLRRPDRRGPLVVDPGLCRRRRRRGDD